MKKLDYFEDVYLKRLNRYGLNYQDRVQNQRERAFEDKLLKSVYRIEFEACGEQTVGTLERYKQDETETLAYLLTRVSTNIPQGTVLYLPNKDNDLIPWLVYYLENMKASGYNRYILLRMTHHISWTDRNGNTQESWVYMYGQENNMLKDELRSRSRMDTLYTENLKMSFFVMPLNANINKDDYIEIGEGDLLEAYRVVGYDRQSTQGVEYVTIDPVYIRDHSAPAQKHCGDTENSFYWLDKGGDSLGSKELLGHRDKPTENYESFDGE